MKTETILEVLDELIGPVEPVGESHIDGKRLENLTKMINVADSLINDIARVAIYQDNHLHSIKEAGRKAKIFLDERGIET